MAEKWANHHAGHIMATKQLSAFLGGEIMTVAAQSEI